MKRYKPQNPFELENLEQRVMLSGDPLIGGIQAIAPDELDLLDGYEESPPLEETLIPGESNSTNNLYSEQTPTYDPSEKVSDIFSGLTEEEPDQPTEVFPDESPDLTNTEPGDSATDPVRASDLSDHEITESEEEAIIRGLDELAKVGCMLEDFDAFWTPLPLTVDATLGRLLGPYEILDDRLSTPVFDYFTDATDPTLEGLFEALYHIPSTPELSVHVDDVSGRYDETSGEIQVSLKYRATRQGQVCLDPGPPVRAHGVQLEEPIDAEYVADHDMDLYAGEFLIIFDGASLTAGEDVELKTGYGSIIIMGSIQSGNGRTCSPEVSIDSGGWVEIYEMFNSLDDVTIWADDGVYVDALITVGDDIEIGTCGELTTTVNAPLEAGDDIELYAKGLVTIGSDVLAGDDVWIKSTYGNVMINGGITAEDQVNFYAGNDLIIGAGITAGSDLELYAKYALTTMTATATLTAGVDIELETRWGDIVLWGAINSGDGQTCSPDVEIDSGGSLFIYGPIISLDDVEIWADEDIFIEAPIVALDEIEIGTCGTLTITANASLTTGDDIELFSKKMLTIDGSVVCNGDDVVIFSCDDIMVAGSIEALDRIEIVTYDNLTLSASSSLTGLNGEKARLVYLRACDNITTDGQIWAEKVIIR